MIVSGLGFSKETTMIYKEFENALPNASQACAREWAPIQTKSLTSLTPPKIVTPPFFDMIYFDPNKTNNNPTAAMEEVRDGILTENPEIRSDIGGPSDSTASDKVNQKTSERRINYRKRAFRINPISRMTG